MAASLATVLELDPLNADSYRGPITGDHYLFGGLVAAQALRAAARTVEAERAPHSLHAYFIRPGSAEEAIVYRVGRDRDGRNVSSRRIEAIQGDKVILHASLSFQVPTRGPKMTPPIPENRPPENFPLRDDLFLGPRQFIDVRSDFEAGTPNRFWVRVKGTIGNDSILQAAALTYLTDLSSGFGQSEHLHLGWARSSLDHAIWFHDRVSVEDWLLVDLNPVRASNGRGTYHGSIHDREGRMGCAYAQEMLLRDWERAPATVRERLGPKGR
jgi:acyl-CoA thioesterase-2